MGLEEREQTREIEGTNYRVIPLTTSYGIKTLTRTLKLIAPLFGSAFKDGNVSVGEIFDKVPRVLGDDDFEYFATAFGRGTRYQVGDKWIPLDEAQREMHFAGRYPAMLKWILFSMEVNFAGFFPGSAGESGEGLLERVKTILSQKTPATAKSADGPG